ncbi:MAG: serine/threonine-protein phosphatase [Desulfovibrio sp.]|nr:MAG: serine/threonine-protein phosphatase [Desulfovibrio sp.]
MKFRTASLSEQGGRDVNQDHCGYRILDKGGCWVVADGLGGHRGGEVASQLAVNTILDRFEAAMGFEAEDLFSYVQAAQEALIAKQAEEPRLTSMRTTLVVMVSDFSTARWAHMGDTRLYLLQGGSAQYRTKDHSVPQAMVDAGDIVEDDMRGHEDRNRLLRALGKEGDLRPAILEKPYTLHQGDAFLLATDGFWEYVWEPEMEISYCKSANPDEWLMRMERRITQRAESDFDNYSALGVFVD